ncbi:MAG: hypothetical protein CMN18_09490 [Roseovarius sp.]|nr:hypothetical protein [Roseovarius sp.]
MKIGIKIKVFALWKSLIDTNKAPSQPWLSHSVFVSVNLDILIGSQVYFTAVHLLRPNLIGASGGHLNTQGLFYGRPCCIEL